MAVSTTKEIVIIGDFRDLHKQGCGQIVDHGNPHYLALSEGDEALNIIFNKSHSVSDLEMVLKGKREETEELYVMANNEIIKVGKKVVIHSI